MPDVQLTPDGRTATVNGQLVALESLPPDQQEQIRGLAAQAQEYEGQMTAGPGGVPIPMDNFQGVPAVDPPAPEGIASPEQPRTAAPGALVSAQAPAPQSPRPGGGTRMVTVTNKTTSRKGIADADEHLKAQEELSERAHGLEVKKAEQATSVAQVQAQAAVETAAINDQAQAAIEGHRQEGAAEAAQHMQRAQDTLAEATELQQQGHDFWADKSAGQKITALIGAMFGGALAGMNGGPNQFLERLDGMMANEQRAHQAKVDGLNKASKSHVSFHDIANARMEDNVAADLLAKTMQLDSVQAKLAEQMAHLDAESGVSIAMGELSLAIDTRKAEAAQALSDRITVNTQKRRVPVKTRPAQAQSGYRLGADGKPLKYIPGTRTTDQQTLDTLSSTDMSEARAISGAGNAMISLVEEMIALRDRLGPQLFTTEGAAEFQLKAKLYHSQVSVMTEQGSMTAADIEMMEGVVPDDLNYTPSDLALFFGHDSKRNQLVGAERTLLGLVNSKIRPYGLALEGTSAPKKRIKGMKTGAK